MFDGVSVALATPFQDGNVDQAGLERLLEHVLDQGVAGLVVTGSTGETPTLSVPERIGVWKTAVQAARGRAFVVAGTGTNATAESIELTRRAADEGVDGCMVVAPYYNKPGPRGLVAHFLAVADASPVPLVLYNVPSRTGVNVPPRVVAEVATHERIVAIKEASASVDQATELLLRTRLTVLSGDDSLTLPFAAAGAHGVVSVAGHLVGRQMVAMLELARAGKRDEAAAIHRRLFPLIGALFLETNPAPLKAALARLGLIENELRLPLVPVGEETAGRLEREMEALGLLSG